ncbi:MAG: anthranilate synthase component I family protein, partial [Dinghuibacter sp.]|nr:anthranilate synthase component I family protein [Dinghuibacter sp.]
KTVNTKSRKETRQLLHQFLSGFEVAEQHPFPVSVAQGVMGYMCYDAVQLFEEIPLQPFSEDDEIPLMRYRLYQYIIAINHFKDELYIIENHTPGVESEAELVETLICSRDVPVFPFERTGSETADTTAEEYLEMVQNGINHCLRGNLFQVVLSRRFSQPFRGDEFNVYRALRNINPGPYLFYFDYGDYRLLGSSPEAQLIVKNGSAIVHPIAGTVKRTGNDEHDKELARQLAADPKENAEHIMLVDLARNDLSRFCTEVSVNRLKQIEYYSHVIHLVSEVSGTVSGNTALHDMLGHCFPAGTLSGAPKYRAMQVINEEERTPRGFYGGTIGLAGFNQQINHAIMIRSFFSRNNRLIYRAGAGVVAASKPENELQEVDNKLAALRKAIEQAETL